MISNILTNLQRAINEMRSVVDLFFIITGYRIPIQVSQSNRIRNCCVCFVITILTSFMRLSRWIPAAIMEISCIRQQNNAPLNVNKR